MHVQSILHGMLQQLAPLQAATYQRKQGSRAVARVLLCLLQGYSS